MTRNSVTVVIIRSLSLSSGKTKESPWVLPCQEYQNKTQTLDVIVVLNSTHHSIHFIHKARVSDTKYPQKAANMWCDNDGTSFNILALSRVISAGQDKTFIFAMCWHLATSCLCYRQTRPLSALWAWHKKGHRERRGNRSYTRYKVKSMKKL